MTHIPVLLKEAIKYLDPKPGEDFIDCTIGGGGHAREILKRIGPNGKLLGIDWSGEAIDYLKKELREFGSRLNLTQGNFRNLKKIAYANSVRKPSGVLLDLGISSAEFANPKLGLSFQVEGPLDMRLSGAGETAAGVVNGWKENDLARLLRQYSNERYAFQIARAIVAARKKKRIITTQNLVEVICGAVPKNYERGRIHPATRTFQALRILINDELGNLEAVLPEAMEILAPGGRLVVISFHSLEDRMVKRFFREEAGIHLQLLTKKPIQAGEEENRANPRARSAHLRAAKKI